MGDKRLVRQIIEERATRSGWPEWLRKTRGLGPSTLREQVEWLEKHVAQNYGAWQPDDVRAAVGSILALLAEPTPDLLRRLAEWYDRHREILVQLGPTVVPNLPGFILREIADAHERARNGNG